MFLAGELSVTELAYLMEEIQNNPESAIVGAVLEWRYVPSGAERAQWDIAEMNFNAKRKKGTIPIRLKRPWHSDKTGAPIPELVPADSPERLAALERLKSNS